MNLFYAAFIPGLQNFIEKVLKERLSDVKILKLLDGAVVFETTVTYDKLNFFCFNNIFAVINIMDDVNGFDTLEKHIRLFINENMNFFKDVISNNSKNFNTFRIVISNENVPASIDEKLRIEAEKFISRLSGLQVNRSLPDTEFWFLYRSDALSKQNFSIFMKRLTLRSSWDKTLHKGELPPPLAWTLCRLADLKHSDAVLDPFCGYGSIPEEAIKRFHITNFIACDNDDDAAKYTQARFKKMKSGQFTFYQTDFNKLPSFAGENTIDAIVTDPPWGQFKGNGGELFLKKMFETFGKLLKNGGRAVILYANTGNFLEVVLDNFEAQNKIPILLSGKKAVIYVFNYTLANQLNELYDDQKE